MSRSIRAVCLTALLCASADAQDLPAEFAAARATVLPTAAELQWLEIPWRDTLAGAVLEADELERPVLLWAMNGHPLGCT